MALSPTDKVDKVIVACRNFTQQPELFPRLDAMIKSAGGGVASTFFGNPDSGTPPQGSLEEMVMKLAVQHLTWQVSKNNRFARAVNEGTAQSGVESFLGRPGSEAAARIIPREAAAAIVDPTAAATTDAGIATQAGFFSGTVVDLSSVSQWQGMQPPGPTPVSFFSLKAGVTALGAAFGPTAHYGQYVSVALFDQHFEEMFKAVHGELNWAALAADRAFVEAYQQRMCEENFIKQEVEFWMNQRYFSVQAALYVSYKLDKNSYAAVCDTWRRIITDVKPDVLAWASDLFDGIISGHALMAPLSTEFNINTPYANTVAEKCNAMEDHTSVIPGMSSPDPMNPLFVPPVITHDYTWGSAVESWLKRGDGPAAGDLPGLTTGTAPDNHERKVDVPTPFSGGGCFVPGTQVLLKGGKSKRIDQLSEGDRVVCDTGDNDRHDHHHRDQKHTPVLGLVSSEHVSIQLAKGSRVIGFNEFEPFFTAEHVFFTTTGLRAVDPLAAQKENDWLKVAPLRVGDVVLHTKDGHTYQHVRINTFTYALYSGPVYGVHLREGLRSYHANGFKVFLNYPEITLERMHKGISAMQPKDTTNLLRQLKEAGPLIDKALGFKLSTYLEHNAGMLHDLPKCLETAATERHLHRKKHGHPVKRNVHGRLLNPGVPLHAVRTMHFSLKHEDHPHVTSITTSRAADALAVAVPVDTHPLSVTLHQGHIMVDGVAPEHQRITEHEVHWSRPLTPDTPEGGPKGIWEHGAMKLASHRLSGFGAMFFTAGMDGPEVGIPKKFTVKGAMRYHTKHAAKPDADNAPEQPVPASAGNDWVAFPDIIIAPDDASGQLDAWLDIRDEDGSPLDASAFTTTFGFSDDNKMTVNITVDPSMIAIVPDKYAYIAYEAWFSYDSLSFGGYMWAYDTDKNENKGARYDWFGNVVPDPAPAVRPTPMMLFAAQPAAVVAPAPAPNGNDVYSNGNAAHSNGNHSNGAVPRIMALKAAAAVTAAAPTVRTFAEPHPMLFTATDTVLSLEALAAIPPPGNDITHKTNMNLMRNAMIWHLDDTTRKDFGMAQPETSSLACGGVDLTSIFTDDEKNMLVNKFGYGYISQIVALSTDDTLSKLYDSDEKKTVDNYMRGSGPGTLSSEKEYNTVNYKTSACTYMFLCKELSQYTTNGQDGKQWAQDFYNHLNNPLTLRGFVNQMRVIGGSEHVHHMCMILNALDPGSLLGQKLAGDIMRTQLSMTVGYVKNDQKDLNQLLVDIMRELITQVLSGQEFGDNTFLAGLASVTKDLMDEYAEEIKKSGKQAPEFMANTMSRMMNNFAAFMRYNKDIPWKAARDWIKSFKSNPDEIKPIVKNPDGSETVEEVTETRLQKIGRWAGYVAQAASVVMVMYFNIQGFLAWKDLNDWQRARLITNTTQVAFGVFRTIAEGTGLVDVSQPISNAAKDGLALNNGVSDAIATTPLEEQVPREAISVEAVEAEMPIESQVGRTAASADIVEGVARFKLGATVMRSINLAFLVAGAVFTGYEIANDVKGSPKFWLDVFSETAQGVVILTEVGALAIDMGLIAATTTLTSVLACTGAFAIVALVVIGIVSMFIHQSQDPPKSPAQIWVEGTGRNFLKPLAAQKKPDPPVLTDKTKLTYGNGNTEVSFTITPPSYVGADKDADGNMSKPYSLTGGYTLSITNSRDADNQPGIDLFKDALTFERKADGSPTDAKVTGLKPGYSYVFSVTCTNTAAEGSKVSDAATLVFTMPKNA